MVLKDEIITGIKAWDLFGENFTFKIKKNKYYTSVIGGITSLGFIFYSLYYLFLTMGDFIQKKDRTTRYTVDYKTEPSISFKNHPYFTIGLCLRDASLKVDPFMSQYLKSEAYYKQNVLDKKLLRATNTTLNLQPCTEDFFNGPLNTIYHIKDFTGCECLNFTNQKRDISLRTKVGNIDEDFIKIEYKDSSSSVNSLNDYLRKNDIKLYTYFPTFRVDEFNLTDPIEIDYQMEIFNIRPRVRDDAKIYINLLNFTDYGSLYANGISKNF
jgi:hypothetical protein